MKIKRFESNPIIHLSMSASLGGNVNGPSLILAPSWLSDPLGRYYLCRIVAHQAGTAPHHLEGTWHPALGTFLPLQSHRRVSRDHDEKRGWPLTIPPKDQGLEGTSWNPKAGATSPPEPGTDVPAISKDGLTRNGGAGALARNPVLDGVRIRQHKSQRKSWVRRYRGDGLGVQRRRRWEVRRDAHRPAGEADARFLFATTAITVARLVTPRCHSGPFRRQWRYR